MTTLRILAVLALLLLAGVALLFFFFYMPSDAPPGTGLTNQTGALGPMSEGLAAVPIAGKLGYIDATGAIVIPARFDQASDFKDGYAVVTHGEAYFWLNKQGKETPIAVDPPNIAFTPHPLQARADAQGLTRDKVYLGETREGLTPVTFYTANTGYLDQTGKLVIAATYISGDPFHEGLAAVRLPKPDGGWGLGGYIDHAGAWVIPPTYATVTSFDRGVAWVAKPGGDMHLIDHAGSTVSQHSYRNVGDAWSDDGTLIAASNQKWGYVDRRGRLVVPQKYVRALPFSEGVARVAIDDDHYAYVDRTGAEVFTGQFNAWLASAVPERYTAMIRPGKAKPSP